MHFIPVYIFIYSLIVCMALYITENIYHPVYLVQMIQKIVTFFVIPVIVGYFGKQWIGKFGKIWRTSFIYGVGFWLLSALIISITYYLLQDVIDWNAIRSSIDVRWVNESTFLFAFLYIMFGNSLIEEYFFRWVVFRVLFERSYILAYSISALMFSLYHITIFGTWFSGYILFLAIFWLFIGGIFFAWLYRKTGDVWWAWIFHIFADLAILVIGYIELFYVKSFHIVFFY